MAKSAEVVLYKDNVHNEIQLLSKILPQIKGLPID
jgi:hypothetical protein